jgi:hypothetical protein
MRFGLTCHLEQVVSEDASCAYSFPYLDANMLRSTPSSGMSLMRCDGGHQTDHNNNTPVGPSASTRAVHRE